MPSRSVLGLALAFAVASMPSAVQASCSSVPECSLTLGIGKLDSQLEKLIAAGMFTAIAAGATLAALREGEERPPLTGVIETVDERGRKHLSLSLVPLPPVAPLASDRSPPPSGAFQFNDTASTVAIAVGGAAILTSVIVGLLHH